MPMKTPAPAAASAAPNACADLLETARLHLREAVLPQLPESVRYDTLMIANALAIAVRETELGEASARRIDAAIHAFYRQMGAVPPKGPAETALAADLRAGRFHGDPAPLHALLAGVVREKLAISNPKRLGAEA